MQNFVKRFTTKFFGKLNLQEGWVGLCTEHGRMLKATKSYCNVLDTDSQTQCCSQRQPKDCRYKKQRRQGCRFFTKNSEKCIDPQIHPIETHLYHQRIKEWHEGKFSISGGYAWTASCHKCDWVWIWMGKNDSWKIVFEQ